MSAAARRTAMHGNHAVATPHRSRTVVALAVLMLCLGQLGACSSTSGPPSPAGPLLLAERHTWGGMCPEGPCRSALAISDDGAWTWSDEAADSQGRISPREVDLLREAIVSSAFSPADGGPTTSGAPLPQPARCEAHADGRSVRYGWAAPGQGWQVVDSCEQAVDPRDPLVVHLEELARRLAP